MHDSRVKAYYKLVNHLKTEAEAYLKAKIDVDYSRVSWWVERLCINFRRCISRHQLCLSVLGQDTESPSAPEVLFCG